MRRGYWKTLLRHLRGKVASGDNTFLHDSTALTLVEVCASDDELLDEAAVIALARTAQGWLFLIDTAGSQVLLQEPDLDASHATGFDLPSFIEALICAVKPGLELGAMVNELELPRPHRGIAD